MSGTYRYIQLNFLDPHWFLHGLPTLGWSRQAFPMLFVEFTFFHRDVNAKTPCNNEGNKISHSLKFRSDTQNKNYTQHLLLKKRRKRACWLSIYKTLICFYCWHSPFVSFYYFMEHLFAEAKEISPFICVISNQFTFRLSPFLLIFFPTERDRERIDKRKRTQAEN